MCLPDAACHKELLRMIMVERIIMVVAMGLNSKIRMLD